MRGKIKYLFILSVIFVMPKNNIAQSKTIDFLKLELSRAKPDTCKVNTLNKLAFAFYSVNPDSTILIAGEAAALAKKIEYQNGEANAYGIAGIGHWAKGNYPDALSNHSRALSIDEAINNKPGIAKRFGNIGAVYFSQADYPKALDNYSRALKMYEVLKGSSDKNMSLTGKSGMAKYLSNIGSIYYSQANYIKALNFYLKALRIDEELENKNGIAANLGNIGLVYLQQADYSKALDYYLKRVALDEESGDQNGMAGNLSNIGMVYYCKGDYTKALDYYFKCLKLNEKSGNQNYMSVNFGNIGNVYKAQADYPKALDYYFKSLKIGEELGDKNAVAINLGCLSGVYFEMALRAYGPNKKALAQKAEEYIKKALPLCDTLKALEYAKAFELTYSRLDSILGNYKGSLKHYYKYIIVKDSIDNEENTKKQTQLEMQYEFDKREAAARIEQEKKDLIAETELKRKEQQRNYFIAGFILVFSLALFILRGYGQKRRANKIITAQKEEVEKQKQLVEEHQKEILDSIHYARRIQRSLLPTEKYIARVLDKK